MFNLQSRGSNTNTVIKITPNNAFHTKNCTIKPFKSLGEVWALNFWWFLVARELCSLPKLFKAGVLQKKKKKETIFFFWTGPVNYIFKNHYNNLTLPSEILFYYQIIPIYASENCSSRQRQTKAPRGKQRLISVQTDRRLAKYCRVSCQHNLIYDSCLRGWP